MTRATLLLAPFLIVGCSEPTGSGPPPVVETVSPSNGPLAGGTAVTITGRNFSDISSVTVGGTEILDRHVVSATQITGTTPAATAAGSADVVVSAGASANSHCTGCFTYLGLAVHAASPTASAVSGGSQVRITGAYFTAITSVTVGGVELGNRTVVSDTEITGTGPALGAGSKDVVVTSSAYGSGSCNGCILYVPANVLAPPIASLSLHTCQVSAGSASCWGLNGSGQLGDGSKVMAATPVSVSGGIAFKSVGTGGAHSCGLTPTGVAFCWGDDAVGQVGAGTGSSSVPVPVSGGITFNSLAVGGGHNCGLTPSGAALCWGGQPGNGGTSNTSVPTPAAAGLRFALLVAGGGFTCGLTPAGVAYCWGVNDAGQLGNGTSTHSPAPVLVSGGLTFTGIAAGGQHACALTAGGDAYCWGSNSAGQLGKGNFYGGSLSPVAVVGGRTFSALEAGSTHTCGIVVSGALYCWGFNQEGALGNGSLASSDAPVAVVGGLTFTAVAPGQYHTCGVSAGATYCWGGDRFEELGNGAAQTFLPVPVSGLDSVPLARGGPYGEYSCALAVGGAAYCWGYNNGQVLGDGTGSARALPTPVSGGLTFRTLAPAGTHNCGLTTGGAAYCWGSGIYGELGAGATLFTSAPIAVTGGLTFSDITAGINHTCALSTSGAAYCWGSNRFGQVGNGTGTDSRDPVLVSGGHTFTQLSAGIWHTCGLEGTAVYCWGEWYGRASIPQWVNPSVDIVSIASGGWHSCGLTSGGSAYCWGWNTKGELGDGSTSPSSSTTAVSGGRTFKTLTVGNEHTCGVTTGGATYCWGFNRYGQLGNDPSPGSTTPVAIQGDPGFSALTAGQDHTCGLTSAGILSCWGDGYYGQLGRGTFGWVTAPVPTALVASAPLGPRR